MRSQRLLRLYGRRVGVSYAAMAAAYPSYADAVAINADGWSYQDKSAIGLTTSQASNLDPVGAPKTLYVARPGFDAAGAAATVVDAVTAMSRVRQAYPNEGLWQAATGAPSAGKSSLSDFVFAADQVYDGDGVLGLANNSAKAYPKPACVWGHHDLRITRDGTLKARLYVSHLFARAGRPVAAVEFIASDGVSSISSGKVTAMASVLHAGSGFYAPYFEFDFTTLATLTAGSCTVDYKVYPWRGPVYQASVDGDGARSIAPGVQTFMNDHDGSYGQAHAMVNLASTGASAAVYATAAAMEAAHTGNVNTAYATIALALTAIVAYNLANHARSELGGGEVHLQNGAYVKDSWNTTNAAFPVTIQRAVSSTSRASVKIQTPAATSSTTPKKLKFSDVTFEKLTAGSFIAFGPSGTLANVLEDYVFICEGVTGLATAAPYGGTVYKFHRLWAIDCDGDNLNMFQRVSTVCDTAIVIGSTNWLINGGVVYAAVGCKQVRDTSSMRLFTSNVNTAWPDGPLVLGHSMLGVSDDRPVFDSTVPNSVGLHIACCIFEKQVLGSTQCVAINADGNVDVVSNFVLTCTTMIGQRLNFLYNDTGIVPIAKDGALRFCLTGETYNSKDDAFAVSPSGGRAEGNWPVQFRVGFRANAHLHGAVGSPSTGAAAGNNWLGEVNALGDVFGTEATGLTAAFAGDASSSGTGLGDGDYTPGALHELATIPAGLAPYPIDMKGRAIANDGSALAGAIQQA